MLLQTNSYIVPKERRAEHARLIRRFRQALARIGCDQFEVYEQVGANWSPGGANGRYVQIMRFRDRQHQQAVQSAERADPGAQAIIAEFCELINFPYQHQHGYFATGFYTSVLPVGPRQAAEYPPEEGDENPPADEIDPAQYEAAPAPAATVTTQTAEDLQSEQEFDLDDAADVPEETGRYEPDAAGQPDVAPIASMPEVRVAGAPTQPLVSREEADLLTAGDLRFEPDVAEAAFSPSSGTPGEGRGGGASAPTLSSPLPVPRPDYQGTEEEQTSQSTTSLETPELALAQPTPAIDLATAAEPPDIRNPEIALTQSQHSAPSTQHSPSAPSTPHSPSVEQSSATAPADLSDLLPDFADDAPVSSPLPPTSPESNLLPDSPEMWEATVVADMPVIEPPAHDPEPTDASVLNPEHSTLSTQHSALSTDQDFDPEAAGLIFDEDSENDGVVADGSEAHAFAYDKPHDDLLPAPENFSADETSAETEGVTSLESDALLDDARLLDFPGSREPGTKVRAALDKDAELLEFEAMVRDMDDPSAEHGRRAH